MYFVSTESYMQDNKTVSSIKVKKQSMTDIIDMYVTPWLHLHPPHQR